MARGKLESLVRVALAAFAAASLLAALPLAAQAARSMSCLYVAAEGASSEGSELERSFMGAQPALLRAFAPSAFLLSAKGFTLSSDGAFSYSAGSPRLLERSGSLALYEVKAELRSPPPPRAQKTQKVEFSLAELVAAGGALQPAARAIELAARKLGWVSGSAWIIEMRLLRAGVIGATVGLARP